MKQPAADTAPTHAGVDWWIVETVELGRTAMPGRILAHQGAEVCRGQRMKVLEVRRARPLDVGDALAIKQSREEIFQLQLAVANAAGALPLGRQLNG